MSANGSGPDTVVAVFEALGTDLLDGEINSKITPPTGATQAEPAPVPAENGQTESYGAYTIKRQRWTKAARGERTRLPQVRGRDPRRGQVITARRRSPEAQVHRAVCDHLHLHAKPDVLWLHVPNGGRRDARTGAILKRMGVIAGASDLLFWHQGNSFALELKSPGGRLSDAQLEFLARFNDAGGHSACAEGIDRALACLEAWGLLRGRAS